MNTKRVRRTAVLFGGLALVLGALIFISGDDETVIRQTGEQRAELTQAKQTLNDAGNQDDVGNQAEWSIPDTSQMTTELPTYGLPTDDHPYNALSNAELADIASVDADAAVLLARRLEGIDSEFWYERAVVLSGNPGPLIEWNYTKNNGGLSYMNEELNVPEAIHAYEIFLVLERLGYSHRPVALFAERLEAASVELAPIKARAMERYERMTNERLEWVGESWGQQL